MATPRRDRAQRRQDERDAPKPATVEPSPGRAGNPDFPLEYTLQGSAGSLTLRFAIPASLALRWEIATSDNPQRSRFAALGLASAAVRKHVPYRHQGVAAYGLQVADWLLSEGVEYRQIIDASNVAWLHCVYDLVSGEEVDAAEGFTGPTSAGSTS